MQEDRNKLIALAAAAAIVIVAVLAIVIARGGGDEGGTSGGPIGDLTQKPAVEVPDGDPPKALRIEDVVKGKGRAARSGDQLEVQYVGVSYSTGTEFDSSWGSGQPFSFKLGEGGVIKGWDRGLVGMKAGGRRKLTIPPELGYGAEGSPPKIAPNETLIFVIDLKKIS